jgi:hypothetical protein
MATGQRTVSLATALACIAIVVKSGCQERLMLRDWCAFSYRIMTLVYFVPAQQ